MKKDKKKLKVKNKTSIIHQFIRQVSPAIQWLFGKYYSAIHVLFMITCVLSLLFSNNIYHLLVVLNIMAFDFLSNVVFRDCPLTTMETKYLGKDGSVNAIFKKKMKDLNINYNCGHIYETQMECIINCFTMIAIKIMVLVIYYIKYEK